MTNSNTYDLLTNAPTPAELLTNLKDLKNGVIGNTWKKVEVAEDERVLAFLLSLLEYPSSRGDVDGPVALELMSETAVIVGALANVGNLTLRPLLLSSTPSSLLTLITSLTTPSESQIPTKQLDRILPHLLRALRNILVSTADMVWGHMWGVGAERKVIGTGLVGEQEVDTKGKQAVGKGWKGEASKALSLIFEPHNLSSLLSLLDTCSDPSILLPLYQLLSRLVALPSHRTALLSFSPLSSPSSSSAIELPLVVQHLVNTVLWSTPSSGKGNYYPTRKPNSKLIEASLDLLAALVKGQPSLSIAIRSWNAYEDIQEDGSRKSELIGILEGLSSNGPANTRIAAASCLTNIIKADKGMRTIDRSKLTAINYRLLEEIVTLLQSEGMEERIKLCFILAALVSDDAALQKSAYERDCPARLISILISVVQDEEKGEMGNDLASRGKEATLLALASLAMQHEPTRSLISDHSPPVLPHLLKALSSPSYGVRAAGCQLARALSRAIAILRTSLMDSGVGEEIFRLLKREIESHKEVEGEYNGEVSDRIWTVEVAATATICNLVADFSPLKTVLLREGGLELLCDLTKSPYEPLALNAMWAIKNMTYRAMDATKIMVATTLGYDRLRFLTSSLTTQSLRIQALEIVQNIFADSSVPEISRTVENIGEDALFDSIIQASKEGQDADLRIPALYVLSNIALGNEKVRNAIVGRVEILEILSNSLNSLNDSIKIPTLRTLRHLIESNSNSKNPNPNHRSRPRQQMIDIFQPYQLKYRLKDLVESSLNISVKEQSIGLLDVLERERGTGGNGGTSSGGR
ncbi:hypothetical protein I302_100699 [Kwoniella bestiolae CBS 10118]|uniref:Armadillo repeat-containing protein 8 n=1 Tax=Kwoniella bestiolae CBS 10118 TaxID=1296100 RepID=A0A1B9G5W5_9TREE|nr:hypothetical protein I302_04074 [Kwoniella bestiolae CBS 10118]OCF26391.1 hypothetical protein I302_04074 [Kwoniella bestiolae CBS 10118]